MFISIYLYINNNLKFIYIYYLLLRNEVDIITFIFALQFYNFISLDKEVFNLFKALYLLLIETFLFFLMLKIN